MTKLVNRAKMSTMTVGTGTMVLMAAEAGYQSFTAAGVVDGDVVRYVIEDGNNWEIGTGTFTALGLTLTRTVSESSNAGSPLVLTGSAVVYVSAAAADLQELVDFADNFVLPTADGSTGQVLTTNGAGTLTFSTITGYSNADVDTHLNTSTAASGEVLSWTGTDYDWISVAAGATSINGLSDGYSDGSSVGLGSGALANDDGSNSNVALGINAGNVVTSGNQNVFLGWGATTNAATRSDAVAIGYLAKSGASSVTVGSLAGQGVGSQSDQNVFLGLRAGRYTNGSNSVALGVDALHGNVLTLMTGGFNVGVGRETGFDLTTGTHNFLGGYRAGYDLTTGSNNVAIGNGALDAATTGGRNIAIGQDAMGAGVATEALGNNVAIGALAGNALTSGTHNIAIGELALTGLSGPVTGRDNIAVGKESGRRITSGAENIAIGGSALRSLTSGEFNVCVGSGAGQSITTSSGNVAIGLNAVQGDRSFSTAVGFRALSAFNTGAGNTVVGYQAGDAITTGQNNTIIGRDAASSGTNDLTTGSNNTIIGNTAEASSATVSNEITLGNSSITRFRVPGAGIDNTSAALSGTTPSVDVGARDTYTLTTSGNTTFTFTGVPSSGQVGTFSLIITAGGTHTLTWPASVDYAGGVAPDAPASGETDVYTFMTIDGGTRFFGFLAGDAMA